jgi:ech hydrogenase subunit D
MEQMVKSILPNELLGEVLKLKNDGYRLVAISCTNKNGMELSYSFDKNYDFLSLRLNVESNAEVESVSVIYPFSFLYENEIKELFGVNIKNITLDFDGNLYKTSIKTPFNTENCSLKENEDGK